MCRLFILSTHVYHIDVSIINGIYGYPTYDNISQCALEGQKAFTFYIARIVQTFETNYRYCVWIGKHAHLENECKVYKMFKFIWFLRISTFCNFCHKNKTEKVAFNFLICIQRIKSSYENRVSKRLVRFDSPGHWDFPSNNQIEVSCMLYKISMMSTTLNLKKATASHNVCVVNSNAFSKYGTWEASFNELNFTLDMLLSTKTIKTYAP